MQDTVLETFAEHVHGDLTHPPLLLFDEPFGALDPVTRLETQQLFLRLRETLGKTALFVTHDVREALLLGSRIALLKNGRVEVLATPSELLRARGEEVELFLACLALPPRDGQGATAKPSSTA